MSLVTVSAKGQVLIPTVIRKALGIAPGCQLDFSIEAGSIRVQVRRQIVPSTVDEGFGLLTCKAPGKRSLGELEMAAGRRGSSKIAPDTNSLPPPGTTEAKVHAQPDVALTRLHGARLPGQYKPGAYRGMKLASIGR